jgi:hypothetical protein
MWLYFWLLLLLSHRGGHYPHDVERSQRLVFRHNVQDEVESRNVGVGHLSSVNTIPQVTKSKFCKDTNKSVNLMSNANPIQCQTKSNSLVKVPGWKLASYLFCQSSVSRRRPFSEAERPLQRQKQCRSGQCRQTWIRNISAVSNRSKMLGLNSTNRLVD